MQRLVLSMLLVNALLACNTRQASVSTAAAGSENTAAVAPESTRILGTEVDPETRKDIIQLDLEQNDANSIGDSEGMIDRMVADDTLWTGATGRMVTIENSTSNGRPPVVVLQQYETTWQSSHPGGAPTAGRRAAR